MKNVTITLPEEIWEGLKNQARDQKTSLNKFAGEILASRVTGDHGKWAEYRAAMRAKYGAGTSTSDPNREETYRERLR